jgi:hypothetical protein
MGALLAAAALPASFAARDGCGGAVEAAEGATSAANARVLAAAAAAPGDDCRLVGALASTNNDAALRRKTALRMRHSTPRSIITQHLPPDVDPVAPLNDPPTLFLPDCDRSLNRACSTNGTCLLGELPIESCLVSELNRRPDDMPRALFGAEPNRALHSMRTAFNQMCTRVNAIQTTSSGARRTGCCTIVTFQTHSLRTTLLVALICFVDPPASFGLLSLMNFHAVSSSRVSKRPHL